MAGTIPISLTSQFGADGKPLVGGKIYFFSAGTTTPQNIYSDTGLTFALQNPITLDSRGFCPQFFCADGVIKFRVTDSAGVVQVEADNVLVIGPSGGGGGGGAAVDPTAILQTGDLIWQDVSGPRNGFVRDNGRTMGSATSGATERANADCNALFTWLWSNFADTICPVPGGRGASALADWSANKQITLPDKRGRNAFGLDDMGNGAAGRFTGVPVVSGSVTTGGSVIGENGHTLTVAELASHPHGVTDPGHHHAAHISGVVSGTSGGNFTAPAVQDIFDPSKPTSMGITDNSTTGVSVNAAGGDAAHNNVPLAVLGTFYRKL